MFLRRFLFILSGSILFTIFFISLAFAAIPNTSITPVPARPDGYFGWYRTVPTITLTSDQPGSTTYYQWDSMTDSWTTYTRPFSALVGNYSLNIYHTLYYYSVSGTDAEQVKFFLFKVDPTLPIRVMGGTCEGCHGPTSYKDQVSFLAPSHYLPTDPIKAPDRCQRCHVAQTSAPGQYPPTPFLRDTVYNYPDGLPYSVMAEDTNRLCSDEQYACHQNPLVNSAYPGRNMFSLTKHSIVGSSGKALTRWPDKNYGFGMCGNCHDPHGVEDPANPGIGISDYRNASSNNLCSKCHDDSKAPPKPAGYLYRGLASYNLAEHSSSTNIYTKWPNVNDTGGGVPLGGTGAKSGECINCHNPHGKEGSLIPKLTLSTEESLCYGGGFGGCHSDAANSENGINILERLSYYPNATSTQVPPPIYTGLYTGHHDITDSDQIAAGSKLECKNCHNPHLDSSLNKMVDPDNLTTSYTATTPDAKGYSSVIIKGTAVTEDTKIRQNYNFNQENTPDSYLWVGEDTSYRVWRTLIKFSIASIPPGVTIDQATLIFQPARKAYDMNINVHRLTQNWTESGATWYMRDGISNWSSPGGSFDSTPATSKNSKYSYIYTGGENFDITSLVSNWYQGTYPNYGMILISSGGYRAFYQSEATGTNQQYIPVLVVRYYYTPPASVLDMTGFCEKCHDGTPPAGVVTPLALKTITEVYFDPLSGEFHGARVGRESYDGTGSLKSPYYAGMPALPCTECHDPHGSSNIYHFKENINGQTVIVTNTTPQAVRNLCQACHNLPAHGFGITRACFDCHYHRGQLNASLLSRDAF